MDGETCLLSLVPTNVGMLSKLHTPTADLAQGIADEELVIEELVSQRARTRSQVDEQTSRYRNFGRRQRGHRGCSVVRRNTTGR